MAKKVVGLRALQAIIADAETKLVVIDVGATWCGPCRIIAPLFESLASEMNHAVFVKVDADESPDVISYFEVKAFPSFLFLRSGNEIERLVGADQPSLSRLVKQLSIKPEPKSTFSFPPPRFVFLAQQGTYAGIATFILSKLKDKHLTGAEAAKLAAVSTSTDENAATALLVREPGVTSKMLCDLLSMLDEEFQFAVVHLIAKMLSSEQGANALALMSGTALSILGQRLPDLAFKVQTITSPKGLQNRHGLAVEAISNGVCHEKTREALLFKALENVLSVEFGKLSERAQIGYATLLLNASIVSWCSRGPEKLHAQICAALLAILSSDGVETISSTALMRLMGAVGTQVFLVHVINSRENGVQWDCEPSMLLSSLDMSSYSDKIGVVASELRKVFELPLQ